MNEIQGTLNISQKMICHLQDALLKDGGSADNAETEHYFASGVYARVMKVKAGNFVIGKAHRTDHISILLKGKASITLDDGTIQVLEAPMINVTPAGKKKMAYVLEDLWFVNVHATDTEDLDVIESRVIIPEHEFRLPFEKTALIEGEI